MYVAVNVNGLTFYTHRGIDEAAREAVRASVLPLIPPDDHVARVAMQQQWNAFVSAPTPSEWRH
jgi:hypothetical protein